MLLTHKFSRRFATIFSVAAAAFAVGCADAPTRANDDVPLRAAALDPSLAVSASTTVGSRITTDRHVQIFALPSRNSAVIGMQKNRVLGTVVQGPSAVTMSEPYALFRINFDTGTDGWVLAAYLSLVSAPPPPPPPPVVPVASVSVTPTSASVAIGASVQLSATTSDSSGNVLTGRPVTWVSSNATMVIVSGTGTVTGAGAGTATVTATSEGRTGTSIITVPPTVVPVATVTLSPTPATIPIGGTQQLGLTVRDAAGNILTDRSVTWTTSNASAATVSTVGLVTGVSAGTATITATSEGRTGTSVITVPTPIVPVATVTLAPASASIAIGGTVRLTATTRDAAGNVLSGRAITWASSNAGIASVSASGNVAGNVAGSATVTATSEGRSGTAAITVQAPPPPTGSSVFASTWNTETGRTTAAFLDANNSRPWLFACCNGAVNTSIVTSASLNLLNWPAGNVYRVGTQSAYPTQIMTHQIVADIGTPTAGSHRYFRYYFQMVIGNDHGSSHEGNLEHGIESSESPTSSGRGMNFYRIPQNDGTWWPGYREISTGWRFIAPGLRLLKNRTYRMEWHLAYGATTYRVEVRIYDENGSLVGTEADFFMLLPYRLESARLGAEAFLYTPSSHRMFRIGTNGPTSGYPMQNLRDEDLYYHGHVAICATNWCGPVTP